MARAMPSARTYFYPRPPRGGRREQVSTANIVQNKFLSTPSARRATKIISTILECLQNFYPRPPRGGRHSFLICRISHLTISIHALREEGDSTPRGLLSVIKYFYPRPPRGGRPCGITREHFITIFLSTPSARRATWYLPALAGFMLYFYPRPPRGGRRDPSLHANSFALFLSTPSARRATCTHAHKETIIQNFYPRPPRGGRQIINLLTVR